MTETVSYAPTCQPPNPDVGTPRIAPPKGACDSHAHVFGPSARYTFVPKRTYTPPDSSAADYLRMLDGLGLSRGVLVQPTVYGTDNSCLLDALDVAPKRLRGIVYLDVLEAADAELRAMTDRGVRGLRVGTARLEKLADGKLRRISERCADFGWHLDMVVGKPAKIQELLPLLADLAAPAVIEGMGMVKGDIPTTHAGFQALLKLVREDRVWVKLSHVYKITVTGIPYADVNPFARELVAANPDRLIWGTDWPHPAVAMPMPSESVLFDMLCDWVPDEAMRKQILVANPNKLYGFA